MSARPSRLVPGQRTGRALGRGPKSPLGRALIGPSALNLVTARPASDAIFNGTGRSFPRTSTMPSSTGSRHRERASFTASRRLPMRAPCACLRLGTQSCRLTSVAEPSLSRPSTSATAPSLLLPLQSPAGWQLSTRSGSSQSMARFGNFFLSASTRPSTEPTPTRIPLTSMRACSAT